MTTELCDSIKANEQAVAVMAAAMRRSMGPNHPNQKLSDLKVVEDWIEWYLKIENTISWGVDSPSEAEKLDWSIHEHGLETAVIDLYKSVSNLVIVAEARGMKEHGAVEQARKALAENLKLFEHCQK